MIEMRDPLEGVIGFDDGYSVEVEVRDGNGRLVGSVGDFVDLTVTFNSEASDVEASAMALPGSSKWAKTFMRANRRLLLVHILLYRDGNQIRRWTGRVDRSVRKREGLQGSINIELISDKIWLKYLMGYSAPGAPLWIQAPKVNNYFGPAVHTIKRIASDNLLRISDNLGLLTGSKWLNEPAKWPGMQEKMPYVMIVPTTETEDTSPTIVSQVMMTPMDEVWQEICKDYNLLPSASFFVPGRDELPDRLSPTQPCVVLDIKDMDRTRARSETRSKWESTFSLLGEFVRGLFGQYDVPPTVDVYDPASIKDFFGHREDDKWVIFRDSSEHWSQIEVASYSPMASKSIAGGKSQEFLNKGVQLIFNLLINGVLAVVGLGFLGIDVGGMFDDVLFAYQAADDINMREFLGDFTLFEEFIGDGMTAFSFDSAQALRAARHNAIGYQTAMFTGDIASFRPFRPFEDFDLLHPVAWEDSIEDKLFAERVKQITVFANRSDKIRFEVRLGEIDRPEEPEAIAARRHESFVRALNTIMRRD